MSRERAAEPTCRDVIEFLRAYLDGELPADTRARFEEHLDACPPCLDYLDSYRATIALASEAFAEAGPDELADAVPEELVQAILAARGTNR